MNRASRVRVAVGLAVGAGIAAAVMVTWPSRASAVAQETRAAPAAPSPVVERVDTSDTGDYAR